MNARRIFAAAAFVILCTGTALAAEAPPGASSCTGCHSAQSGVDAMGTLAGKPQGTLEKAMAAFKSGERQSTIMGRIAKGFTEDEVRAIAAWYAAQKP
jgi:cytochrome c553